MKTIPWVHRPEALHHVLEGSRLPLTVRRHPGMISPEERAALYYTTLNHYRGDGVIVDAGCFLGASTACFAAALNARGATPRKAVHSYDMGVIGSPQMVRLANQASGREDFKKGDSFASLIEAQVAPYQAHVDLRIGDIVAHIAEPDPIEILFIDVCKSAPINATVTRATFPRLLPGRSIVVQQDYMHEWLPWLPITMGHFADRFAYLGAAGGSAFFLCERAISETEAAFDPWSGLDAEASLATFDAGLPERLDADQAYLLAMARAILMRRHYGLESGVEAMQTIVKPPLESVMSNWTMPSKEGVENLIRSPKFFYR